MEWRQRQCGAGEGEASVHMELGDGLAGEGGRRFFMHRELKRGHSRWGGVGAAWAGEPRWDQVGSW